MPPNLRSNIAYIPVIPKHAGPLSPIRPTKIPAVPFRLDLGHTVPTKALYRRLLRRTGRRGIALSPGGHSQDPEHGPGSVTITGLWGLQRKIRESWRKCLPQTSPNRTKNFLTKQYSLLDLLQTSTTQALNQIQTLESHYSKIYANFTNRQTYLSSIPKPKPQLSGGYIRPSHSNPALPRLKPQPPEISGMIRHRVITRDRRIKRQRLNMEWAADIQAETSFWRAAQGGEGGDWTSGGWRMELDKYIKEVEGMLMRDVVRGKGKFTEEVVEKVEKAKRARRGWMAEKAEVKARARREGKTQDVGGEVVDVGVKT